MFTSCPYDSSKLKIPIDRERDCTNIKMYAKDSPRGRLTQRALLATVVPNDDDPVSCNHRFRIQKLHGLSGSHERTANRLRDPSGTESSPRPVHRNARVFTPAKGKRTPGCRWLREGVKKRRNSPSSAARRVVSCRVVQYDATQRDATRCSEEASREESQSTKAKYREFDVLTAMQ